MAQWPSMDGLDLAKIVSTKQPYFAGDENAPLKVAVLDCGIKESILKCLTERGVYAKVYPCSTTFEEMQLWQPDGYFVSNGPGDPAPMPVSYTHLDVYKRQGVRSSWLILARNCCLYAADCIACFFSMRSFCRKNNATINPIINANKAINAKVLKSKV